MATTRLRRLRRRVDRRYYRALFALARLAFPAPRGPVDPAGLRRVLLLPNYKVGDLVVATSALAYLRAAAPNARLDVLVSPRNASLIDGDPRADRVIVHDPARGGWAGLVRQLRRERYDLVVDLVWPHHLREGLLSALVARRGGARATAARPAGYAGFFSHNVRVPGVHRRHMAERMLRVVQTALGVRPDADPAAAPARWPMALAVPPEADAVAEDFLDTAGVGPFVAFNVWGSDHTRTLTAAQAEAVLVALAGRHPGLTFVLTPAPAHAADAAAIAAAVGERLGVPGRVLVYPPADDLRRLAALVRRAAVVFSPDTAVVHLGAALGRPTVALYTTYATREPSQWAPSAVPHRIVVVRAPQLVRDVAPAEAVAAFEALWGEVGPIADAGRDSALGGWRDAG